MAASIQASEIGLQMVEQARRKKGWTKKATAWCEAAGAISPSTLDRFWAGKPISQEYFVAICREGEAYALRNLAELHQVLGKVEMARQYCQQALALATELGIPLAAECQTLMDELGER